MEAAVLVPLPERVGVLVVLPVPTTTTDEVETVVVLLVTTVPLLGRGEGVPVGASMVEVDSEIVLMVAGIMEIEMVPVTVAVSEGVVRIWMW